MVPPSSVRKSSPQAMASEPDSAKHCRYDPTMSRRTRKSRVSSPDQDDKLNNDDNGIQHASLKELMNQSYKEKANGECDQGDATGGKKQDVAEEKSQLAIVLKQGEGVDGIKTGGMVSRYVKVLSRLVKARRDSKKRSAVRLLIQ